MFNFPKEEPLVFTAPDLIALLKMYNREFKKAPSEKIGRYPGTREACYSAALDAISSDPFHRRVICRIWPRSPTGKHILPQNSIQGKQTPNGIQLWGATMFDFYRVQRFPDVAGLSTITSGSKLLRWMKANGELDAAEDEIACAENEEEPKVIEPCSLRYLIEEQEHEIRTGKAGATMPKSSNPKTIDNETFDPCNYPSPWPLVPFSHPSKSLHTRLPLHYLPNVITVHDPWNLLAVESSNRYGEANFSKNPDWTKVTDRKHLYRLQLTSAGKKRLREELKSLSSSGKSELAQPVEDSIVLSNEYEELVANQKGYLIPPSPDNLGSIPPPIFVLHDPPPARPSVDIAANGEGQRSPGGFGPIKHAHLYLSPDHFIGDGNHSVVYRAEWEIPRSSAVPPPSTHPVLCKECISADIQRILQEEDGDHGERMEARWKEKRSIFRKVVEVVRSSISFDVMRRAGGADQTILVDPGELSCKFEFEGPVRPIRTTVGWQDPLKPTCEHLEPPPVVPPTVKVRVVAKLSNAGDEHLQNEAGNYQKFEQDMFEHWSGLNVLPPMHDPFPVGALVPQFYGYYVPEPEIAEQVEQEAFTDDVEMLSGEEDDDEGEGCDFDAEESASTTSSVEATATEGVGDVRQTETQEDIRMIAEGEIKDQVGEEKSAENEGGDEGAKGWSLGTQEMDAASTPRKGNMKVGSGASTSNKPERQKPRGYLSPILLMEDCGTQVSINDLTTDEKNEVSSLIYRFHHAGWFHGSVYQRNILCQDGPLNVPLEQRARNKGKRQLSFRLIDFGRS